MIDVRRLRFLRELETRGTIAAVADAFDFSPSAVSQQLAQLQKETGVELLEHVGRGVRLTPAARGLVTRIDAIFSQLDEVESALARMSDQISGTVHVAAFQSAAETLVPPALGALAIQAPELNVELIEAEPEDSLEELVRGNVDVVVAEDYLGTPRSRHPQLDRRELGLDPVLLGLEEDHPLARSGGPVRLADLADADWIFTHTDTSYAQMTTRTCIELGGFEPRVRHRANDFAVVRALVSAGQGVAFVPKLFGRLDAVAVREVGERPLRRMVFTAARKSSAAHPAVAAVRGALEREAESLLSKAP